MMAVMDMKARNIILKHDEVRRNAAIVCGACSVVALGCFFITGVGLPIILMAGIVGGAFRYHKSNEAKERFKKILSGIETHRKDRESRGFDRE